LASAPSWLSFLSPEQELQDATPNVNALAISGMNIFLMLKIVNYSNYKYNFKI
jgi:hypothetical protein